MRTGAEAAALLRSLNLTPERPSPGESRPAEARRVAEPLGMQARGSATGLRAARVGERRRAAGEEAAGIRLGAGEVLDHPVQHGLELAQAVHGLLHDREGEETICQLPIRLLCCYTKFGTLPVNVRWQWHENELVTSLPTVAMNDIISWRKSWNPWNTQNTWLAGEPDKSSNSRPRAMGIGWVLLTSTSSWSSSSGSYIPAS
jgi:hypothetical protein